MKVIFIEDVPGTARVGQTRVVADGYARNYLLPKKLAVLADSPAAVAVEGQIKRKIKQRELEEAEMAEAARKLDGIEITIKARVGDKEKLYGSVTGADIAEELGKQVGHEIDKKKVELAEPIRHLGSFSVPLRFTHDITADIKVTVVSDEPEPVEEKVEKKPRARKAPKAETAADEPVVDEPVVKSNAKVVGEEEIEPGE